MPYCICHFLSGFNPHWQLQAESTCTSPPNKNTDEALKCLSFFFFFFLFQLCFQSLFSHLTCVFSTFLLTLNNILSHVHSSLCNNCFEFHAVTVKTLVKLHIVVINCPQDQLGTFLEELDVKLSSFGDFNILLSPSRIRSQMAYHP